MSIFLFLACHWHFFFEQKTSTLFAVIQHKACFPRIREYPPRIKPSSKPFGDHFDLGDELGRGVQGVVYHAAERLSGIVKYC